MAPSPLSASFSLYPFPLLSRPLTSSSSLLLLRRAHAPFVPYLGIVLNELSGVVEALPTYIEGDLVNFTKMRRVSSATPPP